MSTWRILLVSRAPSLNLPVMSTSSGITPQAGGSPGLLMRARSASRSRKNSFSACLLTSFVSTAFFVQFACNVVSVFRACSARSALTFRSFASFSSSPFANSRRHSTTAAHSVDDSSSESFASSSGVPFAEPTNASSGIASSAAVVAGAGAAEGIMGSVPPAGAG